MTAMIIDASGVRAASNALEVGKQVAAGQFFWLDITGGDLSARHAFLSEAGLNAANAAWALRLGQAGRMHIEEEGCARRPGSPTTRAISSNSISLAGTNALSPYGEAILPPSTTSVGSSPSAWEGSRTIFTRRPAFCCSFYSEHSAPPSKSST